MTPPDEGWLLIYTEVLVGSDVVRAERLIHVDTWTDARVQQGICDELMTHLAQKIIDKVDPTVMVEKV